MATKTIVTATEAAAPIKAVAEPAKSESQEDLRRRRAGIACFL